MKKIAACVLLLFISCTTISYDGGTRLVIQGKVVDSDNNPIANQDVEIELYDDRFSNDLISIGKTNSDGQFIFNFPKPEGEILTRVLVKPKNDFLEKQIIGIKPNKYVGFKFDCGNITLAKSNQIVQISVVQRGSAGKYLTNVSLTGNFFESITDLEQIPNNNVFFNSIFKEVYVNQNLVLKYTVVSTAFQPAQTTDFVVNIPIASVAVNYTINY